MLNCFVEINSTFFFNSNLVLFYKMKATVILNMFFFNKRMPGPHHAWLCYITVATLFWSILHEASNSTKNASEAECFAHQTLTTSDFPLVYILLPK